MKYKLSALALLTAAILAGCEPLPPEEHRIMDGGTEWGVEIEVLLKGGGTATLVCPKFIGRPAGEHGRECYLRDYNKQPFREGGANES